MHFASLMLFCPSHRIWSCSRLPAESATSAFPLPTNPTTPQQLVLHRISTHFGCITFSTAQRQERSSCSACNATFRRRASPPSLRAAASALDSKGPRNQWNPLVIFCRTLETSSKSGLAFPRPPWNSCTADFWGFHWHWAFRTLGIYPGFVSVAKAPAQCQSDGSKPHRHTFDQQHLRTEDFPRLI